IWKGAQHYFTAFVECWKPGGDLLNLPAEVAVGEHDAFGNTGSSAGVLVHGHIVKRKFNQGRIGRMSGQNVFPFEKVVSRFYICGQFFLFGDQRE
ncbi:hypothetical protein LCGC14_2269980, partial [marine sediment metagenome]